MKNELLVTRNVRRAALALTLGAVLLGSLAGAMPARAGDGPPPSPPLQNLIGDLQARGAASQSGVGQPKSVGGPH